MPCSEPQIVRLGAKTLTDPPEYFCTNCGGFRMWEGAPEKKYDRCIYCLSDQLVWSTFNDPDLMDLKRVWLEERAAKNAELLASMQAIADGAAPAELAEPEPAATQESEHE
jgi:hypothetical protein